MRRSDYSRTGITWFSCMGTALATVISYTMWNSIAWAIVHGLFGWFYVLYYAIKY